jgi:hypothetical protein
MQNYKSGTIRNLGLATISETVGLGPDPDMVLHEMECDHYVNPEILIYLLGN